jgi:hypothetical protein
MKTSACCQPKLVLMVGGYTCKTKAAATRRLADLMAQRIVKLLDSIRRGTPREMDWRVQRVLYLKLRKDKRLKRAASYYTAKWMKS